MKKIAISLMFLLLAPLLCASTNGSNNLPNQQGQSLTINSQAFGFHGPLSIGSEYRKNYGFILNARYTQTIGHNDALSLFLQGGKEQRRVNLTWALLITKDQRIKLSIERLWQDMDFDFASGDTNKWMAQNAYGGTYEFLLNHSWLNNVNLNAYYSHANNKNLSSIIFFNNGNPCLNLRRIAGGTDKSISAGIDLIPESKTKLNLKLNYEDLNFDTKYNNKHKNTTGLGFGVTLQQILTKHIQLKLLANGSRSYDSFGTQLALLLPSARGTMLQLNLNAQRNIGHSSLPSDNIFSVVFDYRWGLGNTYHDQFKLIRNYNTINLASWAATPAVDMPQVLAIKDEKVIKLYNSEKTITSAAHLKNYNLYFYKNENVVIKLIDYIPLVSKPRQRIKVSNLPKSWHYNSSDGEITGFINKTPQIKNPTPIYINVQTIINDKVTKPDVNITLLVHVLSAQKPYPNPNLTLNPIIIKHGETLPKQTFEVASTDPNSKTELFINPDGKQYPITHISIINPDKKSGIHCNTNKALTEIICTGTGGTPNTYHAKIKVKNNAFNEWSTPRNITFTVTNNGQPPKWKKNPKRQSTKVNKEIDDVNLADSFKNSSHSGPITFKDNNIQSISVTAPLSDSTSTLRASPLGQHGIHLSGTTLEGTLDNDSSLAGKYIIVFKAKNDAGYAKKAAKFTLSIKAPPARNSQQPTNQTASQGNNINPVNLANYFNNPSNSGSLSFRRNKKRSITITTPKGKKRTLAASPLYKKGNGIHLSGNTLRGTVPNNTPSGNYKITFKAKNAAGFADQSATFTLNVTGHAWQPLS